jgi:hypothetical protein
MYLLIMEKMEGEEEREKEGWIIGKNVKDWPL